MNKENTVCKCGTEMSLVRYIDSDEMKEYKQLICTNKKCLLELGSRMYHEKYGTYIQ